MNKKNATRLVSAIIPTYNGKLLVDDCLDSMLAQENCDVEIIVVDDGSTDGTPAYLKQKYKDAITLIEQPNMKVAKARSNALSHAKGEFVAFCDQDDYWLPGKIEAQLKLFEENETLVAAHTEAEQLFVDTGDRNFYSQLHSSMLANDAFLENMIKHYDVPLMSTVMIRRSFFAAHAIDYANYAPWVDDIGLFIEAAALNGPFGYISTPLTVRKMHSRNQSSYYLSRFENRVALYGPLMDKYENYKEKLVYRNVYGLLRWGYVDAAYRTADHHFSEGNYPEAKRFYRMVLDVAPLHTKARLKWLAISTGMEGTLRRIAKALSS